MTAALISGWLKVDLGEGAFYAAFGFLFVFCGIALLILIFTLLGLLMKKINARRAEKGQKSPSAPPPAEAQAPVRAAAEPVPEGEVTPELIAAITAAITAYCGEKKKGDFVVRRIKRL